MSSFKMFLARILWKWPLMKILCGVGLGLIMLLFPLVAVFLGNKISPFLFSFFATMSDGVITIHPMGVIYMFLSWGLAICIWTLTGSSIAIWRENLPEVLVLRAAKKFPPDERPSIVENLINNILRGSSPKPLKQWLDSYDEFLQIDHNEDWHKKELRRLLKRKEELEKILFERSELLGV